MEHQFVTALEKAFGWSGPALLGSTFTRGALPDPDLAARLLTPTGLLDLVMRRSLTMDALRVLVGGVDLHPRSYLGRSPARRGLPVPMADMQRLGRLLAEGCTLILDMAQMFDPTLEVACRALQRWTREIAQVNCYLTTGTAAGFELHWDDFVRHEALSNRAGVKGPCRPAVAADGQKLRAVRPGRRREGQEAALTTTGRIGTARRCGPANETRRCTRGTSANVP